MAANEFIAKDERPAIESQQNDLEGLGPTANDMAFLFNPNDGVYYNVFANAWRWASRYLKGKHGQTHR
jgi:hypothetical protein